MQVRKDIEKFKAEDKYRDILKCPQIDAKQYTNIRTLCIY